MAILSFNGFETGDASQLPAALSTSMSVASDFPNTGTYALKCVPSAGASVFQMIEGSLSLSSAYARIWLRTAVTGTPTASSSQFQFRYASNYIAYVYLSRNVSGDLLISLSYLNNADAPVNPAEFVVVSAATYYCIELFCTPGAGTGVLTVKVNGVILYDQSSLSIKATNITETWVAHNVDDASNYLTAWWDDYARADAWPGLGRCIARQGKAGTPNANAWTKNGDTTAALCWSETPYSATKNCVSATNTAQTMLVADVGAGTNAIGASDTINACQVVGIGKFDSAAAALTFYRVRRRLNSVNTDEDVTPYITTTTDVKFQSSIFTDTRTNLQSSEVGGVVGTGGGTRKQLQYEDLWMMVDYTVFVASTNYDRLALMGVS